MPNSNTGDKLALGSAIAGGALVAALIEVLFDKGALTLEESRTVLDRALRNVGFHQRANGGRAGGGGVPPLRWGGLSPRGGARRSLRLTRSVVAWGGAQR